MRNLVQIGDKTYATKKDALNHYKNILNSYDFGETISHDNLSDLLDLLETHPKVKEMIGVGIEKVRIGKLKSGNYKVFYKDIENGEHIIGEFTIE